MNARGTPMRWLVTVVVIAIVAFLGYRYFYTDEGQQVAEQVEQTAEDAAQAVEGKAEEATGAVEGAADEAAQSTEQAAEEATGSAEQMARSAEDATAALTVGGVNLGEEIGTTVSDATSAL